MSWPKGKRRGSKTPGSGRKPGSPQKLVPGPKSPELREMVLRALDQITPLEMGAAQAAQSKRADEFFAAMDAGLPPA